jgi:hypothetical protein
MIVIIIIIVPRIIQIFSIHDNLPLERYPLNGSFQSSASCSTVGPDQTGLEQTGLDQTGTDWTRLEQTGLDWTGLVPVQHSWNPHYDQQFSISKRGTKCQNIMIFIIFGEEFQYVCWSKGYSQSSANHALGQWVNLTSSLVHFLS